MTFFSNRTFETENILAFRYIIV